MYRKQDWYDVFDFSYDMSVPNVAHLEPMRGGCCTVMPYFVGNIVELPLTLAQDYSLFHILDDYSIDLWKQQLALIRGQNGLMSFIVHPDYVIERRARRVYESLLDYLETNRRARTHMGCPSRGGRPLVEGEEPDELGCTREQLGNHWARKRKGTVGVRGARWSRAGI